MGLAGGSCERDLIVINHLFNDQGVDRNWRSIRIGPFIGLTPMNGLKCCSGQTIIVMASGFLAVKQLLMRAKASNIIQR